MSADLSSFDLDDPEQFLKAADVVAKSVHGDFGDQFAVKQDEQVYINVGVLLALVKANTTNAIVHAFSGREGEKVGIELVKQSIALSAMVTEAKASV